MQKDIGLNFLSLFTTAFSISQGCSFSSEFDRCIWRNGMNWPRLLMQILLEWNRTFTWTVFLSREKLDIISSGSRELFEASRSRPGHSITLDRFLSGIGIQRNLHSLLPISSVTNSHTNEVQARNSLLTLAHSWSRQTFYPNTLIRGTEKDSFRFIFLQKLAIFEQMTAAPSMPVLTSSNYPRGIHIPGFPHPSRLTFPLKKSRAWKNFPSFSALFFASNSPSPLEFLMSMQNRETDETPIDW